MAGLVFLKETRLTATACQFLISGTNVSLTFLDTFGAYQKLAFGFGLNLRGLSLIIFFVLGVFSSACCSLCPGLSENVQQLCIELGPKTKIIR